MTEVLCVYCLRYLLVVNVWHTSHYLLSPKVLFKVASTLFLDHDYAIWGAGRIAHMGKKVEKPQSFPVSHYNKTYQGLSKPQSIHFCHCLTNSGWHVGSSTQNPELLCCLARVLITGSLYRLHWTWAEKNKSLFLLFYLQSICTSTM